MATTLLLQFYPTQWNRFCKLTAACDLHILRNEERETMSIYNFQLKITNVCELGTQIVQTTHMKYLSLDYLYSLGTTLIIFVLIFVNFGVHM